NLSQQRIQSVADVRRAQQPLVEFSSQVRALKAGLESFLHRAVYQHYRVLRMAAKGGRIVRALFEEFERHPEQLPLRYARRARENSLVQTVCDYLAGMTDRYAQDEYLRLFQPYALM